MTHPLSYEVNLRGGPLGDPPPFQTQCQTPLGQTPSSLSLSECSLSPLQLRSWEAVFGVSPSWGGDTRGGRRQPTPHQGQEGRVPKAVSLDACSARPSPRQPGTTQPPTPPRPPGNQGRPPKEPTLSLPGGTVPPRGSVREGGVRTGWVPEQTQVGSLSSPLPISYQSCRSCSRARFLFAQRKTNKDLGEEALCKSDSHTQRETPDAKLRPTLTQV